SSAAHPPPAHAATTAAATSTHTHRIAVLPESPLPPALYHSPAPCGRGQGGGVWRRQAPKTLRALRAPSPSPNPRPPGAAAPPLPPPPPPPARGGGLPPPASAIPPPSTTWIAPVVKLARSEASQRIALAISAGRATRCIGRPCVSFA